MDYMPPRLTIAVVGLGFGRTFADLYRLHPEVAEVVICDADPDKVARYQAETGGGRVLSNFATVLADPTITAVHLATPIPLHAEQAVAALSAGKHVACAVPAAVSLADCERLVIAERQSGRRYFMAETMAYSATLFLVKEYIRQNRFGRVQHLRGIHFQDMEGWPPYWAGLPPMWYATHAVAPLALLAGAPISRVSAFGSGVMRAELQNTYRNPWPIETAHFQFAELPLSASVTRSLFAAALPSAEQFDVIGEDMSFLGGYPHEHPTLLTAVAEPNKPRRSIQRQTVHPPLRWDLLPTPGFRQAVALAHPHPTQPHRASIFDGHEGSHPHLVDEFVRCILDDRPSAIDAATAANWCAAGVLAHESALRQGAVLDVPAFR